MASQVCAPSGAKIREPDLFHIEHIPDEGKRPIDRTLVNDERRCEAHDVLVRLLGEDALVLQRLAGNGGRHRLAA